jgi:cation transport regulator ChaC
MTRKWRDRDKSTPIKATGNSLQFRVKMTVYLFGYGSLINNESRRKTVPDCVTAIPIKVMGFERSWSYKCPKNNYTAVSVTRTTKNHSINGVLIPLQDPNTELLLLDKREYCYARGVIPIDSIIPLHNTDIVKDAIVWVYETPTNLAKNYSSTSKDVDRLIHVPSPVCPIPMSYLDVILSGCLSFGYEFAKEFLLSTKGWCSKSLVNDRNWKQQKCFNRMNRCNTVDQLLRDCLPNEFKRLKFNT